MLFVSYLFVHEGQKFQCPQCEHKATKKGHLQTHLKSVHEGQKFECTQCKYKATNKTLIQKHEKSAHVKVRSEVKLKTEYLSDNDEEYFEADVKSECDFDRSKKLKHEFISDSDKEGMTEYFETDVKSEV